jgi:hypothetical protein
MNRPSASPPPLRSRRTGILQVLLAALAGAAFLILNTVHLGGQGLYYDEVFQAIGSFAYIGRPAQGFSTLEVQGIPLMNMNYIGAIKTALYGLYLRLWDASFSVTSWRLVGILSVSLALFAFGWITRKKVSLPILLCFYLLILTDITVLLTTRFDWGPVALSLSFRLVMIATWLNGELSDRFPSLNTFFIGAILGISIFEKLSAFVLVVPALLMVFSSGQRWNIKHVSMFLLGGLAGTVPLILANLISYNRSHTFISLQNQAIYSFKTRSLPNFVQFLREYVSLGAGGRVAAFILGIRQAVPADVEMTLLLLLLVVIVLAGIRRVERDLRLPVVMLLCYFFVALGLYFLPTETWAHHWVIGTPFQYAAIALFIPVIQNTSYSKERLFLKAVFVLVLVVFGLSRLSGLTTLEQAYGRDDTSTAWSPSLTRLGNFAAEKSNEAIFVTGDWGVANQMISFVNGRPKIVYSMIWTSENIDTIVKTVGGRQGRSFISCSPIRRISPGPK